MGDLSASSLGRIDEQLHATAAAAVGLEDFGDDGYRDGLSRIVDGLAANAPDEEVLLATVTAATAGPLQGRLWSQEGWRRRPEVLDVPVAAPVVIVGIPRTGTTALHKLLSIDERFQVLEKWIIPHPMPRPARSTWEAQPAYQAAVEAFEAAPEVLRRTHLVEPHEADECLALMGQSFTSNMFGSIFELPAYDDWMLAADMTPSFERLADNLRLIAADDPASPWLLKNPSHVLCLDELLAVFPDAVIVQTHRHPQEAVGSVVSLLCALRGDEDPLPRARRELRIWGEGARRADTARAGREGRFCDVDYRRFLTDPMGVVADVYERAGLALPPGTAARMRSWIEAHPQNSQGEHRYDPAQLGVTDAAVAAEFGDYIARHDLDRT